MIVMIMILNINKLIKEMMMIISISYTTANINQFEWKVIMGLFQTDVKDWGRGLGNGEDLICCFALSCKKTICKDIFYFIKKLYCTVSTCHYHHLQQQRLKEEYGVSSDMSMQSM